MYNAPNRDSTPRNCDLKPPLPIFHLLALAQYANFDAFSFRNNISDADISADRRSFPAELLPASNSVVVVNSVPFQFPNKADGYNNVITCNGQNLLFPIAAAIQAVHILAYGDGDEYADRFDIAHQNSIVSQQLLRINEGRRPEPTENVEIGIRTPYHYENYVKTLGNHTMWSHIMLLEKPTLASSIILPDNPFIHVIAITIHLADVIKTDVSFSETDDVR